MGKKFKNAHNPKVKAHLDKLRAEGKVAPRNPYGTWTCKICGKIFETRSELKKHMKSVHNSGCVAKKVKWYKVKNLEGKEFSVRGHWEENVALRLNELGILWVKAAPIRYFKDYWHNYIPDLYIPDRDIYVEVKG